MTLANKKLSALALAGMMTGLLALPQGAAAQPHVFVGLTSLATEVIARHLPFTTLSSKALMARFETVSFPRVAKPAAPAPRRDEQPKAVFATLTVPFGNLPAARSWKSVRGTVNAGIPVCGSDCTPAQKRLANVLARAQGMSFREKLQAVNGSINTSIRYTADAELYRQKDHWATPAETLGRQKGDCEDYALLKMAALRSLGFPEASMSIVILRVTDRKLYHAVLAVSTSEGHFILDNLRPNVTLDRSYSNYMPLYSVSADRAWIHGRQAGEGPVAIRELGNPEDVPG